MKRALVIWGNWGPYHHARFRAFREAGRGHGYEVEGLELYPSSGYYDWEVATEADGVHRLNIGPVESKFHPWRMTRLALPKIFSLRPDVVFVPSYWPWSLYINLAVRLRRCRVVMMNETHAGTERARGWKKGIKKAIVRRFHAALVGGAPHRRYFAGLGLDPEKIFTGYDAVDNRYFEERSRKARERAAAFRRELGLPERYFLSLGRMVEKKNLPALIEAFCIFRKNNPESRHHLVFVGSGDKEADLRSACQEMNLSVTDHSVSRNSDRTAPTSEGGTAESGDGADVTTMTTTEPGVHFFGFRQIRENPVFYALADAFILPSLYEEWGLVVNEAMACGLPVIVSREAGCAEDLVIHKRNGLTFDPRSSNELAQCMGFLATQADKSATFGAESKKIVANFGVEAFATNALRAAEASLKQTTATAPAR